MREYSRPLDQLRIARIALLNKLMKKDGWATGAMQDVVRAVDAHDELVDALADLLSTEECVCESAELEKGNCSVCIYTKLIERVTGCKLNDFDASTMIKAEGKS